MESFLWTWAITLGALLASAIALHLLALTGPAGRRLLHWGARAPGLDLLITWFTVLPPIAGAIYAGWRGLLAGILAQVAAVLLWGWGHELFHRRAAKGPRIVKVLNRLVGRPRNHAAVWITSLAVPIFWLVRLGEWVIYPPLVWLVRFPRYPMGQWVNVSRHKFEGLVGHDLIWCLYCDWMTGVWSLGSEMLRNVESFWCPIRFLDDKKCANCSIDFPDVLTKWTPPDGTMSDVAALLAREYEGPRRPERNSWFGHRDRVKLTVEGEPPSGDDA